MAHTPKQLRLVGFAGLTEDLISPRAVFFIPGENQIGVGTEEQIANAKFIVRAWNNHDALLAACKSLVEEISLSGIDGDMSDDFRKALEVAHITIAKAEGKGS